jgi:hypothetical protein
MALCVSLACPSLAQQGPLTEPVHFKNYHELFEFIARDNGLEATNEVVTKLSADSRVEYRLAQNKDSRIRAVIEADYIDTNEFPGVNSLRGASGNGLFYVIEFELNGIDLIGVLEGNGWELRTIDGRESYVTSWHMSAYEFVETVYEFNGRAFVKTTSRTVNTEEGQ